MKLTQIKEIPFELPSELKEKISDARIYDSSCSPEARVYLADCDGGYFIKAGAPRALEKEAAMTEYFHSLRLSAEVIYYGSGERDILVTRRVPGKDLTSSEYLESPFETAKKMGEYLRALHELDSRGCPIMHRTKDYLSVAFEGYGIKRFDPSYIDGSLRISDMESAMGYVEKNMHLLEENVLLHGDFCLPNIIFDGGKLSGYIDLGGGGIGDRHVDLFWGAWTLNFNLHTEKYRDIFFDAYGRDKIDEERLLLVSAIEAFG